jgi:alkylation response protein AidB-like acyl-CoA dehydrogenase
MPDSLADAPALALRALSDGEVAELRATVREVVTASGGPAVARGLEHPVDGTDYDVATWRTLAEDIGLAGLGLPEAVGGVGGLVELLAVSEELGRGVAAVPFLSSTVLAGQVLLRCGSAATEALTRIAAGEIATVAVADAAGRPAVGGVATLDSTQDDGSVRISGHAPFVTDGASAVLLVVPVSTPEGVDLVLVDPTTTGVARRPMPVLDFSRPQADVVLESAAGVRLTTGGAGAQALREGLDVAALALAAEQLGGTQESFDRTVEYIKVRRQFNREIGSFQAVKHRVADALSLVEQSRSAVERSAWDDVDAEQLAEAAAIASAWCSEAFVAVTAEMVQLHGGIGFTWEHDAHLFFRRARADAVLWGDATYHRERLAQLRGW